MIKLSCKEQESFSYELNFNIKIRNKLLQKNQKKSITIL
jgi:hypothetical protein